MAKLTEVKIVCDLLNGIENQENQANPLYKKSVEISNFLKNYFGKITLAIDTENDFSSLGDLKIRVGEEEFDLELKKIESNNQGKGTLANTSQNIFSELGLINMAMGWSEWRKINQYESKILKSLDKSGISEIEVEEIGKEEVLMDKNSTLEKKARVVRKQVYAIAKKYNLKKGAMASLINKIEREYFDKLNNKEKSVVETIREILNYAREDLKGYLDDCKTKGINIDNLRKMMALLKCGYHTVPLLKEEMKLSLDEILNKIRNYYIIYYYPNQSVINKRFKIEDPQKIVEWIERYKTINAEIKGESLWISSKGIHILQFKFHWRNVFFGIATPSVEIFDKTN